MLKPEVRGSEWTQRRDALRQLGAQSQGLTVAASLTAVLALGAITRLYGLGTKSLWLDETFSVFVARQPLERMLDIIVRHDTPPPLYYSILHLWLQLGDTAFNARLLSALLGTATIAAVYWLAQDLAGRRVALVAALLMAVSPFQVWYGQEIRMYSLLALLCSLSACLLFRALSRGGTGLWAAYAVASALALYTQVSAGFFLLGEGVAAALFISLSPRGEEGGRRELQLPATGGGGTPLLPLGGNWDTGGARRGAVGMRPAAILRPWLLSQVAVVALWLPWLPNFLRQGQTYWDFWIPAPTPERLQGLLFELTSAYLPHWRVPYGQELLAAGALLLVLLATTRLAGREAAFLLALLVVPVGATYLVSQVKPIFLSRTLICVAVPYLVLLAAGVDRLRGWRLQTVVLALLVLLNLVSLYRIYFFEPKEEWDLASGYVAARATSGELVLFVAADAQIAFDYYAAGQSKVLEEHGLPVDALTVGPLEPEIGETDLARMDQLVSRHSSFWLVDSHSAYPDPGGLVRRHADRHYRLTEEMQFYGVKVLHYATTPAPKTAGGPSATGR